MKVFNSFVLILTLVLIALIIGCTGRKSREFIIPQKKVLTVEVLQDKIKGGWAGQTIGVTYGGPTEFKYNSMIIPDSISIPWPESGYCKWWFTNSPGLYDDLYMDLTFVQVFEEYGLDATVDNFAKAFAHAPYPLWHANQAARYNILNGIMPPESGYWKNNPHADDIDFQIEADFAGLMAPGMPVTASKICDKIGHIMSYGDGWYGGTYISTMYTLAFITDDIDVIVREALKIIPPESDFYKMMKDVISWSEQYDDWKETWKKLEDKWGADKTCPQGYMNPFNIEAKMNCAYILMGLLYGKGDIGKTIEISTRCGQDSDCNPSNAAGILGTALGYNNIPDYWLNNVKEVEDILFPYTNLTLNNIYKLSLKHAIEMIQRNGGEIKGDKIVISCQVPIPMKFEKSFEGIAPTKKEYLTKSLKSESFSYNFEGSGILISAHYLGDRQSTSEYVAYVEILIDGNLVETVNFPANFMVRKLDLYWNYDLMKGKHRLELKLLNPVHDRTIILDYIIIYEQE